MRKLSFLFVALVLAMSGCAGVSSPAQSETVTNNDLPPVMKTTNSPSEIPIPSASDNPYHTSFDEWASFQDWSGSLLDYESTDITTIGLRYVLGWTLDDPAPRKIYQGDIICGLEVAWAESHYFVDYSIWGRPPYLTPNYDAVYSFSDLIDEILLSGLVIRTTETYGDNNEYTSSTTNFYPYNKENGSNFPIIMPYYMNESNTFDKWHHYFQALSSIKIGDGSALEVQPIGFRVDESLFPADGEVFNVTLKLSGLEIGLSGQSRDSEPVEQYSRASVIEILSIETLL